MLAAVDRAGVRLQVGLMRRHDPDHIRARARIVAGELGRLLLFSSRQYDVDAPPPGILDPRSGGGIMLDMGIHEFDSARFLMGSEVVEVQATGSVQAFPEAAAFGDVDTAVVNLQFASGALGSIETEPAGRVRRGRPDGGPRHRRERVRRRPADRRRVGDRPGGRHRLGRDAGVDAALRHRPTPTRRGPSPGRSRTIDR